MQSFLVCLLKTKLGHFIHVQTARQLWRGSSEWVVRLNHKIPQWLNNKGRSITGFITVFRKFFGNFPWKMKWKSSSAGTAFIHNQIICKKSPNRPAPLNKTLIRKKSLQIFKEFWWKKTIIKHSALLKYFSNL